MFVMGNFGKTCWYAALTVLFSNVTGCGGDGGEPSPAPAPRGPTVQGRINAATQTAYRNLACNCGALPEGFYWEIGDRNGSLASGTVSGTSTPTASQLIAIASSSKWVYSTYVLQKQGSVRTSDVPFLHFTSGYVFLALKASRLVTRRSTAIVACPSGVLTKTGPSAEV